MKKKITILLAVCFLILLLGCAQEDSKNTSLNEEEPPKYIVPLNDFYLKPNYPYSDSVYCSLKLSAMSTFDENELSIVAGIDEKPTVVTISGLNSEFPSLIGNLGDKVQLVKLSGNIDSRAYLMEITEVGNVNVWTLLRDKNIIILSKQYDMMGIVPVGLLMMGDCNSSS